MSDLNKDKSNIENPQGVVLIGGKGKKRDDSPKWPKIMNDYNVCDALSEVLPYWSMYTPVLIDADTGAGKSTFVKRHVCPLAKERGVNVLVVTNRVGLANQFKSSMIEMHGGKSGIDFDYLDMQNINRIGNVNFCNYQGLYSCLNKVKEMNIGYVVFDECHYFFSDSLFADNTYSLLERAIRAFKDVTRIYMTATKWGVWDKISDLETALLKGRFIELGALFSKYPVLDTFGSFEKTRYAKPGEFSIYEFSRKEKRIKLVPLPHSVRDRDYEPIIDVVKKSPDEEKWVIFVESKEKGKDLRTALEEALDGENLVSYVDADMKDSPAWKNLILNERFETRVLIATAVADCGVNVWDPAVKHLVIMSTERTRFIQEVGRKRLADGEEIFVYVPDLSLQQMARMENANKKLVNLVNQVNSAKGDYQRQHMIRQRLWYAGDVQERHLVDLNFGSGELVVNEFAEKYVERRSNFFEDLRSDFANGVKAPFVSKVAGWLNVPVPQSPVSEEELLEQVNEFLEAQLGKEISDEEKDDFTGRLKEFHEALFGPSGKNDSREKKEGIKMPTAREMVGEFNLGYTLVGGTKNASWCVAKQI